MQVVGFWKRFAAHLIDSIILSFVFVIISFIAFIPIFATIATTTTLEPSVEIIPIALTLFLNAFLIILQIAYMVLLEASSIQGTIGKKVLGIIVVDESGKRITVKQSFARTLSKLFLSWFFYIGYIMIGVTEKKQGLHDKIAKTYCVEASRHKIWIRFSEYKKGCQTMKNKKCSVCCEKKVIVHSEFAFHPFEWTKIRLCATCHKTKKWNESHSPRVVVHGFKRLTLLDDEGNPKPTYSIAAGLDYPWVGPEHSHLKVSGRAEYVTITAAETLLAC